MLNSGMKVSMLQPYSLGIVASNKENNSARIEVTPVEDFPFLDGEVTGNATTLSVSLPDANGNKKESTVNVASSIEAVWLPIGQPNRMTPPNVRRGEQVMIYKFGDSDEVYYWNTLRNDLRFRKLETVIFAISATSKEGVDVDETNTYLFECSSHNKMIRLHTSQANGEPFGYDIELDLDIGTFTIKDTDGNFFTLASKQKQFRIENSSGNYVDLTDGVLSMFTSDSINMETSAYSLKADTSTTKAETISVTASSTELTSSTLTVTAATTHNGNIALAGSLSQGGGGGGGSNTFASPIEVPSIDADSANITSISATTIAASASCTAPNIR